MNTDQQTQGGREWISVKVGDKAVCPDGSIQTVVGYDLDIKLHFVFIQGAKCFIDGPDYKIIQP